MTNWMKEGIDRFKLVTGDGIRAQEIVERAINRELTQEDHETIDEVIDPMVFNTLHRLEHHANSEAEYLSAIKVTILTSMAWGIFMAKRNLI